MDIYKNRMKPVMTIEDEIFSVSSKMSSMPVHLKALLKHLEFLAMIEEGKKPCLANMKFVDAKSWIGAWQRTGVESKKELLTHIDSVVEQTFIAIQDERNKEYIPNLIKTLSRARVGIVNTTVTYKDYPSFISEIRVILTNIDMQLRKFEPGESLI